jgi:hypothetical protein
MKFDVTEIDSSLVQRVEYDDVDQDLTVTFPNGSVYKYERVSNSEFLDLIQAGSIGKHFNYHIKGAKDCEQISGPTE